PVASDLFTLSLHDALPILNSSCEVSSTSWSDRAFWMRTLRSRSPTACAYVGVVIPVPGLIARSVHDRSADRSPWSRSEAILPLSDRKSTRLNSSHRTISYA